MSIDQTGAQRADQLRMIFSDRVCNLVGWASRDAGGTLSTEAAETCVLRAAEEVVATLDKRRRAGK